MLQLSNDFGSFSNGKPHFERASSRPDIAWVADRGRRFVNRPSWVQLLSCSLLPTR